MDLDIDLGSVELRHQFTNQCLPCFILLFIGPSIQQKYLSDFRSSTAEVMLFCMVAEWIAASKVFNSNHFPKQFITCRYFLFSKIFKVGICWLQRKEGLARTTCQTSGDRKGWEKKLGKFRHISKLAKQFWIGCPSLLTWPSADIPPAALQHFSAELQLRVTALGFYSRAVAGTKRERSELIQQEGREGKVLQWQNLSEILLI